jgi:hypothetical protein
MLTLKDLNFGNPRTFTTVWALNCLNSTRIKKKYWLDIFSKLLTKHYLKWNLQGSRIFLHRSRIMLHGSRIDLSLYKLSLQSRTSKTPKGALKTHNLYSMKNRLSEPFKW